MDSLYFNYNGVFSGDMGVLSVKIPASDLPRKHFLDPKEVVFDQIPYRDLPYIYTVKPSVLRFTLWLALDDGGYWDTETRASIASWLDNGRINEFYSYDDPDKRYFILLESAPDLYTTAMGERSEGYIQVNFMSVSPYTYSPAYNQVFDLSTITSSTTITFANKGYADLYPDLEIIKYGAGDLTITNLSNGGQQFKFTALADQEDITIDNENRIITTASGIPRYDAFNGNYLCLPRGNNQLQVSGACKLSFNFRYIFKG